MVEAHRLLRCRLAVDLLSSLRSVDAERCVWYGLGVISS